METQLPVGLQIALYVALASNLVFVVGLVIGLLYVRKQVDRVVRSAEELRAIVAPMVQEIKITAQRIGSVTARAEESWLALEAAIATVRDYGRLANRTIGRSAAVIAAPVHAASRTAQVLTRSMQVFFRVLLSRTP